MIIKLDKEWEQVINQLLDTFLKVNWLAANDSVNQVRASIEVLEEKDILNTKK